MFGIAAAKMRELENEVDNKECGRDERIRRQEENQEGDGKKVACCFSGCLRDQLESNIEDIVAGRGEFRYKLISQGCHSNQDEELN